MSDSSNNNSKFINVFIQKLNTIDQKERKSSAEAFLKKLEAFLKDPANKKNLPVFLVKTEKEWQDFKKLLSEKELNDALESLNTLQKNYKLKYFSIGIESEDEDIPDMEVFQPSNITADKTPLTLKAPELLEEISRIAAKDLDSIEVANPPITALVFEGGGAKGVTYIGVTKALGELGLYSQIENVAGSSAGAMNAFMMAMGLSAEQFYQFLSQTAPAKRVA